MKRTNTRAKARNGTVTNGMTRLKSSTARKVESSNTIWRM